MTIVITKEQNEKLQSFALSSILSLNILVESVLVLSLATDRVVCSLAGIERQAEAYLGVGDFQIKPNQASSAMAWPCLAI